MIHLYCGDGKGKTTAAAGLAVRACGSGMRVLFAQFFKNGSSSEMNVLSTLENVTTAAPEVFFGRFKHMTEDQTAQIGDCYRSFLSEIIEKADFYDLIVLDEAVSVYRYGLFDREDLLRFLKREKEKREIVLTGRDPAPELKEIADYVTEMKKEKHPFDRGITARKGIEF